MKKIPLRNNKDEIVEHAKVDDDDFKWLSAWKWYLSDDGYAVRNSTKDGVSQRIYMHHAIVERHPEEFAK